MALTDANSPHEEAERLAAFIRRHPRLAVLTGAGCSTASGIPEYRDDKGNWVHRQPMQYADFVNRPDQRRRYWAQSLAGWQRIAGARPNAAHFAIARLERLGLVNALITQNVDNLHRAAGSRNIIDLHGVLHQIRCIGCNHIEARQAFQSRLRAHNPDWTAEVAGHAPDGDARLAGADFSEFSVPDCDRCGGILKPHVVFFGEAVPADRVTQACNVVESADALLVVGSSLMVYSGFRFARAASEHGKPIAIVNRGVTRADDLALLKLGTDCSELLTATVGLLAA